MSHSMRSSSFYSDDSLTAEVVTTSAASEKAQKRRFCFELEKNDGADGENGRKLKKVETPLTAVTQQPTIYNYKLYCG